MVDYDKEAEERRKEITNIPLTQEEWFTVAMIMGAHHHDLVGEELCPSKRACVESVKPEQIKEILLKIAVAVGAIAPEESENARNAPRSV